MPGIDTPIKNNRKVNQTQRSEASEAMPPRKETTKDSRHHSIREDQVFTWSKTT